MHLWNNTILVLMVETLQAFKSFYYSYCENMAELFTGYNFTYICPGHIQNGALHLLL